MNAMIINSQILLNSIGGLHFSINLAHRKLVNSETRLVNITPSAELISGNASIDGFLITRKQ